MKTLWFAACVALAGTCLSGCQKDVSTVPGANAPPTVDAGSDLSTMIGLLGSALVIDLDGTVGDDGLPNPPGTMTTSWTVVSAPGPVTIADPAAVNTTADFSQFPFLGTYVLRLTASDGALSASDEVTITLLDCPMCGPVPAVNAAPVVDAGADQDVQFFPVYLNGEVSDDALPDPPGIMTSAWTLVSGPGEVSFDDAAAPDTTVSFSQVGPYILSLTASDGQLETTDYVTITVLDDTGWIGPPQPMP